jgi:hypothetical protein
MFKVHLNLSYQSATSLSADQLPLGALDISNSEVNPQKVDALREVVDQFNAVGDDLLTNVFSTFYDEHKFCFNVIYTSGVSAPYDAWTVSIDDSPVVFFNLSEWTVEELFKQGLAVVIHEVTHALLEPFLKGLESGSPLKSLEKIVFDEGMAHFLGFPGDRFTLLERYYEKWLQSEADLKNAQEILGSIQVTDAEKEDLLLRSNTGSFWNKFGAISGMFRFAKIYSLSGSAGLADAIKDAQLPEY